MPGSSRPTGLSGAPGTYDDLVAGREADFQSAPTAFDDTAVILYTSGTTGHPKGAELSHANIIMNVMILARIRPIDPDGGRMLIALPLFHVMAQTCAMHLALYNAMTIVLVQRFDAAEVIRLLLEEDIANFHGVPTMYRAILDCTDVTPDERAMLGERLESFAAGGASLPPELQKECMETFGISMSNGYGATEDVARVLLPPDGRGHTDRIHRDRGLGYPSEDRRRLRRGRAGRRDGRTPGARPLRHEGILQGP